MVTFLSWGRWSMLWRKEWRCDISEMIHHFENNSQVTLNSNEYKQKMLTFLKASKLNCFFHQLKPFWEGKIRKKEIRKKHLRKGKLARCTMMDPASGNSCTMHTETMPAELLLARHRVVWMTAAARAEGCLVPNCPPDPWRPPAHHDDSIPSRGRTYGSRAFWPV